ncbi:MAG: hypothetical protein LBD27_00710 [Tannerella sp.]|jgi:hypothetical protein|nr:hypothetical protein [Tannerella sp.]
MRNDKEIIRRIVSVFLLTLFVSYVANTAFFVHTHMVDGQLVTHSHPYRGTPDNPGHGHSTAQFQTIAQLSYVLLSAVLSIAFTCSFAGKKALWNLSIPYAGEKACLFSFNLRAPPVC